MSTALERLQQLLEQETACKEIVTYLVENPYEPPMFIPRPSAETCQACRTAPVGFEIHYFGDGWSGGYWVCTSEVYNTLAAKPPHRQGQAGT